MTHKDGDSPATRPVEGQVGHLTPAPPGRAATVVLANLRACRWSRDPMAPVAEEPYASGGAAAAANAALRFAAYAESLCFFSAASPSRILVHDDGACIPPHGQLSSVMGGGGAGGST